jgi:hypothetical protein
VEQLAEVWATFVAPRSALVWIAVVFRKDTAASLVLDSRRTSLGFNVSNASLSLSSAARTCIHALTTFVVSLHDAGIPCVSYPSSEPDFPSANRPAVLVRYTSLISAASLSNHVRFRPADSGSGCCPGRPRGLKDASRSNRTSAEKTAQAGERSRGLLRC